LSKCSKNQWVATGKNLAIMPCVHIQGDGALNVILGPSIKKIYLINLLLMVSKFISSKYKKSELRKKKKKKFIFLQPLHGFN